jgi:hypothetical protein
MDAIHSLLGISSLPGGLDIQIEKLEKIDSSTVRIEICAAFPYGRLVVSVLDFGHELSTLQPSIKCALTELKEYFNKYPTIPIGISEVQLEISPDGVLIWQVTTTASAGVAFAILKAVQGAPKCDRCDTNDTAYSLMGLGMGMGSSNKRKRRSRTT